MNDRLSFIRNLGKEVAVELNCKESTSKFGMFINSVTASPGFSGLFYYPCFIEEYLPNECRLSPVIEVNYSQLRHEKVEDATILKRYEEKMNKAPYLRAEHPFKYLEEKHWSFMPMDREVLREFEDLVSEEKTSSRYSISIRRSSHHQTHFSDNKIINFGYPSATKDETWWLTVGENVIRDFKDLTYFLRTLKIINESIPTVEDLVKKLD